MRRRQKRLAEVQVKNPLHAEPARARSAIWLNSASGIVLFVRMFAAPSRAQPMQSTLQITVFSSSIPRCGRRGLGGASFFLQALQIAAARAGGNRHFPFRQIVAKFLRDRAEENFLERIFPQIAEMPAAVVILAVARNRQVGIDGDVVFRFAGERGAIIFAPGDFRAQFKPARLSSSGRNR